MGKWIALVGVLLGIAVRLTEALYTHQIVRQIEQSLSENEKHNWMPWGHKGHVEILRRHTELFPNSNLRLRVKLLRYLPAVIVILALLVAAVLPR